MSTSSLHPRFLQARIYEALEDTPVVLIHGPRQSGKTTLARQVGNSRGYSYISFDDDVQRAAAQADPTGFVAELPGKVILDEVQRVPDLFTSLKTEVDRDRRPGRFILTGSANVLLLPKLADSLAGRMETLRLYPLAQAELEARPSDFLENLFGGNFKAGAGRRLGRELAQRIAAGGYPAALSRAKSARQAAWYRDYIGAIVQRDVRDLARISALDALPRLMATAAGQTARLINISDLAAPFQLSRPTIRDYMTLLAQVFLLEELPTWHNNRLKRLVKTPKLHLGDTGLACALLDVNAEALWADRSLLGQLLETFVYQELRRQAGWADTATQFYHFRDKDGVEVDIVLERGSQKLAGVEIKAAASVKASDFKGLTKLRETVGNQFCGGVVLYDGDAVVPFGEKLHAVPISRLWQSE